MTRTTPRETASALTVRTTFIAVVIALGAVLVVPVVLLSNADSNETSKAFISTPQFVLWMLLLCAQAAVWVLAVGYIFNVVRSRRREVKSSECYEPVTTVLIVTVAVALLALAVVFGLLTRLHLGPIRSDLRHLSFSADFPLANGGWRLQPLVSFAFFVGVLAVVGMSFTAVRFDQLKREGGPADHLPDLTSFISLRDDALVLLAMVGAIVGLGTLSTGALREAVLATNGEPVLVELIKADPGAALKFAPEYVLAYGLYFSGLLALAFAPCFIAMRNTGAWLRDRAYPLTAPTDTTFADIVAKRKALDVLLQTNLSASGTFKAGVAILTPLAASLVTLVLPK